MTSIVASEIVAAQPMLIDNWTARKTDDNKVSVVDVIADVTKKSNNYAAQLYKRLLAEERVPECEVRALAARKYSLATAPSCSQTTRRGGPRGNQLTPVATAAEMVEIVWQLPGTADFRRNWGGSGDLGAGWQRLFFAVHSYVHFYVHSPIQCSIQFPIQFPIQLEGQ